VTDSPEYDAVPVLDQILASGALEGAWYAWWSSEEEDDEEDDEDPDVLIVRADGELYAFWHGWRMDGPALCAVQRGKPGWPWLPDDVLVGVLARSTAADPAPYRVRRRVGADGDHVVEALRADTEEVVLEDGWEWYSYSHRPKVDVSLDYVAVGSVPGPGEEVELSTPAADGEYAAARLILMQYPTPAGFPIAPDPIPGPVSSPRDWEVVDIRVGGRTQLSSPGPIPAVMFSPASVDAAMNLDPVTPGNAVSIIARHFGAGPVDSRLLAQVQLVAAAEVSRRARRLLLRANPPLLREMPR